MFDSLISGLEAQGLAPEAARTAVLHHARGAAELCLARPDLQSRAISRDVAAPGSYTAAGLRYLEDGGVHARLRIALESVLRALRRPGRDRWPSRSFPDPPTSRHERNVTRMPAGRGRRPRVVQWQR
ncbi:pyrroline-5-carboxylate reductase dimerization domain-containing protein [Achromobacter xylosoxidans]